MSLPNMSGYLLPPFGRIVRRARNVLIMLALFSLGWGLGAYWHSLRVSEELGGWREYSARMQDLIDSSEFHGFTFGAVLPPGGPENSYMALGVLEGGKVVGITLRGDCVALEAF